MSNVLLMLNFCQCVFVSLKLVSREDMHDLSYKVRNEKNLLKSTSNNIISATKHNLFLLVRHLIPPSFASGLFRFDVAFFRRLTHCFEDFIL